MSKAFRYGDNVVVLMGDHKNKIGTVADTFVNGRGDRCAKVVVNTNFGRLQMLFLATRQIKHAR